MSNFKVIVVGGGLAGALLANGLERRGIDYMVYERDIKDDKNRDGYQIRLGSPALAGFRTCLNDDMFKTLMAKFAGTGGFVAEAPLFYDRSLNCLIDLTQFPAYPKTAPINRVILRNFFTKPLYDAGKMKYEKKWTKYEVIKSGDAERVKVFFEDGTEDECDLLIAADGSNSRINRQVGVDNLMQMTHEWGFSGKCKLTLDQIRAKTPTIRGAPVGCFLAVDESMVLFFAVYMPTNEDDESKREQEQGLASVFWGLTVPSDRVPNNNGFTIPDKLQFCLDKLKNWDPRYHEMLRMVDKNDIMPYQARISKQPPADWRQKAKEAAKAEGNLSKGCDHVWLIGDAMHPMLPSRGMGGNQAMRDTVDMMPEIETLVSKHQDKTLTEADFSQGVQEYEKKMMPRAFGWVKASCSLDGEAYPKPRTLKGMFIWFLIARALNVIQMYTTVRSSLTGWMPDKSVSPDLPEEIIVYNEVTKGEL